jgi:SAM-dependent methyltransferase
MARWDDGYVTDVTYTDNVYREMTPSWLAFASLLLGQRPPDLSRPFRYADLGCGVGMTALFVAATCPQAEVWGFDFNPAHIEMARRCATAVGLTNITFVEASFETLADLPAADLPEFDFIVSHGVLSWISAANRQHMTDVIGQRLRAGGLAYISYNALTGWSGMVPLRELMRLFAATQPGRSDQAAIGALELIERIRAGGARYLANAPELVERLNVLRKQNSRYLAHEFLNVDWHPVMFAEVMETMADARCTYLGSATLAENIDVASVPADLIPILAETRDLRTRETLRDLAMARAFRRDIYRRGLVQLLPLEQVALLEEIHFTPTGVLPEGEISFATPIGTLTGRVEVYQPLLSVLRAAPATPAELRRADPGRPPGEVMQALTFLTNAGHIHPMLPDPTAGRATTRTLNRWIAQFNADGGEMPRLAVPATGSMLAIDLLETLVVGQLLDGAPREVATLARDVIALLQRAGRNLQRDGKPLETPQEVEQHSQQIVQTMLDTRVPLLQALGVLDGGTSR